MSDIVDRLKQHIIAISNFEEAAAEIIRLRARVDELEMEIALCSGGCTLTCSHANAAKAANETEGK